MPPPDTPLTELLEQRGALLRGHFRLASGRHSDTYIEKFRVLEDAALTAELGRALAAQSPGAFDVVASPAVGAIVLGYATALAGGARFVFSERSDGRMTFQRGFQLAPGERTVVVEDVVTTGGSTREVLELVRAAGGTPVGVVALVDRSGADPGLGVPFRALARVAATSWDPAECPLCADGVPLTDPKQG